MRTNKFLFLVCSSLIILSCNNDSPLQLVKIDHRNWNKNSLEFLSAKCDIENDSLKLGSDQVVPLIAEEDTISTFYEYLEKCFENRKILVERLNDSLRVNSALRVFENYTMNAGVKYLVQIDEKFNMSYRVIDGVLKMTNKEEGLSSIFVPLDSVWCVDESKSVPQNIWIWSSYFTDRGIETHGASLTY